MKLTGLNTVASGYLSQQQINENFTIIQTAWENNLSRDGTIPNFMTADLDMNSNQILNAVFDLTFTDITGTLPIDRGGTGNTTIAGTLLNYGFTSYGKTLVGLSNSTSLKSLLAYTTTDVAEGSNLYYTTARFNTNFSSKTTSDLTEGTNLYYTATRFNNAFATKSTSDLSEGTRLYYTDERVDDRVAALLVQGTGINLTYNDGAGTLTIDATGGGVVTSVSGTTNRVTSTGGTTPAIDIASNYVGQTSITTLGTIATGTWSGLFGAVSGANLTNITGANVSGNISGSAATLTTGRTIGITGDLTYTSPSFNGSANVTAAGTLATVNANIGSFGSAIASPAFTVNAKGLITAASSSTITPAESSITFTDITTNNASTTKHGYLPKLDNNSAHFLNGQGAWATPAGGGGGGSPGGSQYEIQLNDGASGFTADSTLYYDTADKVFSAGDPSIAAIRADGLNSQCSMLTIGGSGIGAASFQCNVSGSTSLIAALADFIAFGGTTSELFMLNGFNSIQVNHLAGLTSAPTIAAGAGAGTSPTVSIASGSTDLAGCVNVTTGTLPTGTNAVVATITFNKSFVTSAPFIVLYPANAVTATLSGVSMVFVTSTTTTFVITSGTTALTGSTAYKWNYHVIQ